jgi:hypothetical protein
VVSSEHFTDSAFDRSMLAEIQKKIVEKGKRNSASRLLHAKNDKEMIAAWKSDLNKVLLVFNVRSVVAVWLPITDYSQTELALNTHTIVSGMDHNVANTHTMVSDIHHVIVKSQGGVDSKNVLVSIACTVSITERTLTIA